VSRFDIRRAVITRTGLAAGSLLAAAVLAGCGAGQISQVANQEPAVNGTVGKVGNLSLRNVHLQAVETKDAVAPGSDVELIFTAVNNSPDTDDRLLSVTSPVGNVSLTGDTTIPVNGLLAVGAPDGVEELASVEAADGAGASVTLTQPIRNGLTYEFTFDFAKAGKTTLAVPISAGNAGRQEAQ
jgi:copper(I)-binding protein